VSGASSASFSYTYDPVGNVMSAAQTMPGNADNGTWTYGYDTQNRLTSAQLNSNPSTAYAYDGSGNRTAVGSVTTTYDSAGIPTSSSDGTTYGFDAVGDLTSITGPRTWTFTYDSWSRTKTAAGSGGAPSIAYTSDAMDRMTKRVRNGVTT
jgi:YD repeat-containing protein